MEFSRILKQERKSNNWTQREMAEKLNVTLKAYQSYEALGKGRREPDIALLIKMADILDISVDYLLGRENYKI